MEELFNGQLSFADIEAEQFLQIRRTHADRRVNAMDRLTDDVINELIQGSSSKPPSLNDGGADLFKRVTFDQVLKSVESSRER